MLLSSLSKTKPKERELVADSINKKKKQLLPFANKKATRGWTKTKKKKSEENQ